MIIYYLLSIIVTFLIMYYCLKGEITSQNRWIIFVFLLIAFSPLINIIGAISALIVRFEN